jgi:hypothetical protein
MSVICVMETIQPLLIDLWINQIKQLLHQSYAQAHTGGQRIPAGLSATAPGFAAGNQTYFWADTFNRQASGFFHIDTGTGSESIKKLRSAQKMRNTSGKILLFPFVFLLILLDEITKLFRAKTLENRDEKSAENKYEPKSGKF